MADHANKKGTDKERLNAEKAERLAAELRANLRKRKELQRRRGGIAPDAIKNRDKITD
ncbi:hypothetical protein [Sneathiella sp.]|uniref:hypothetical protein n=1 Tax=Sneathiella sp. TaxID=1964365 RepID=UPI0025F5AD8C|nr:hypothetical protein [Sneathiella sp.]